MACREIPQIAIVHDEKACEPLDRNIKVDWIAQKCIMRDLHAEGKVVRHERPLPTNDQKRYPTIG